VRTVSRARHRDNVFERSRRAGEIGAVIDYRDLTGGRSRIRDSVLLEKMIPLFSRLSRCR
jgi:hypothetical protein